MPLSKIKLKILYNQNDITVELTENKMPLHHSICLVLVHTEQSADQNRKLLNQFTCYIISLKMSTCTRSIIQIYWIIIGWESLP